MLSPDSCHSTTSNSCHPTTSVPTSLVVTWQHTSFGMLNGDVSQERFDRLRYEETKFSKCAIDPIKSWNAFIITFVPLIFRFESSAIAVVVSKGTRWSRMYNHAKKIVLCISFRNFFFLIAHCFFANINFSLVDGINLRTHILLQGKSLRILNNLLILLSQIVSHKISYKYSWSGINTCWF